MDGNKIKTMKKYSWLWAAISLLWLSASCADDELVKQVIPAADGSEIIFGARAGFENSKSGSRTVYSGTDYKYNGTLYERVDWVYDTDKVEIYCPEASNQRAHYYVRYGGEDRYDELPSNGNTVDDHLNSYSYLEKIEETSIQWNGDKDHTFYAMYPSSEMFRVGLEDITVKQGLEMTDDQVLVNGIVPTSQNGEVVYSNGNYTIKPDMRYAYMVAKNSANRNDASVELSFVPIVTALEVEMIIPVNETEDVFDVEMSEIRLEAPGIAGNFTVNLKDWTPTPDNPYPACENVGEGQDYINISTYYDNFPIKLKEGETVKFTVFMRPGTDISNLNVSYIPVNGKISKTLPVTIKKNLKTRINKLYLPAVYEAEEQIVVDNSIWMRQLPLKTKLSKLSIPGTGGSFSYRYTADKNGYNRSQHTHMSIKEQWKQGIRAFEIVTDRQADSKFGDEKLKCNNDDLGVKVSAAVDSLITMIDASYDAETQRSETAMLIFTYQPEGKRGYDRDPSTYMTNLMSFLNNNSNLAGRLVKYSPNLYLEEAQGKLMIVVRPTQNDEDGPSEWTAVQEAITGTHADNILVINGCGTAKDRWGSRGYKVSYQNYTVTSTQTGGSSFRPTYSYSYSYTYEKDKKAPDISNSASHNERGNNGSEFSRSYPTEVSSNTYAYYDFVEAYMATEESYQLSSSNKLSITPAGGNANDEVTVTRGDMDFAFTTNGGFHCWYQEWQRVVEKNVLKAAGRWSVNRARYPAIYWFGSYDEKVSNICETFEMAISGEHSNYVFINSLCGYLAKEDGTESLVPSVFTGSSTSVFGGSEGDIRALSKKLNTMFYEYVLTSGLEQKSGPTGVVLMDYVNNKAVAGEEGAYYLPGVIINNNFKHSILDDDDDDGDGNGNGNGNKDPNPPTEEEV